MKPKETTEGGAPVYLTVGGAKELVDEIVREATRTLARDLENHLRDIDTRIKKLEGKR